MEHITDPSLTENKPLQAEVWWQTEGAKLSNLWLRVGDSLNKALGESETEEASSNDRNMCLLSVDHWLEFRVYRPVSSPNQELSRVDKADLHLINAGTVELDYSWLHQ